MAIGPDRFQNFGESRQLTLEHALDGTHALDDTQGRIPDQLPLSAIGRPSSSRTERRESECSSWVIRKMPRSWRLELRTLPSSDKPAGIRSSQKALQIHCALLRQIYGLSLGHFSVLSLPTALIRATSPMIGSFHDRDLNPELVGSTPIERRLYNFALMETTRRYLAGEENWICVDRPESTNSFRDRWSEIIWRQDSQYLRQAFDQIILPLYQRPSQQRDKLLVEDVGT